MLAPDTRARKKAAFLAAGPRQGWVLGFGETPVSGIKNKLKKREGKETVNSQRGGKELALEIWNMYILLALLLPHVRGSLSAVGCACLGRNWGAVDELCSQRERTPGK